MSHAAAKSHDRYTQSARRGILLSRNTRGRGRTGHGTQKKEAAAVHHAAAKPGCPPLTTPE
jgi:hypothetical protein